MFTIVTRNAEEVTVLDLRGGLVRGESITSLRSAIRHQLDRGNLRLLLNFTNVSDVDSAGFGEVRQCHAIITKMGGELRLCSLRNTFWNLMEIGSLGGDVQMFATEPAALNSFAVVVN